MTTEKPKIKLEKLLIAKELYLQDNPFNYPESQLQEDAEAIASFIAYAGNNLEYGHGKQHKRGQKK